MRFHISSLLVLVFGLMTVLAPVGVRSQAAHGAEIFVTSLGEFPNHVGIVGAYNLDGSPMNPTLISGLNNPQGIAVSGGNLFVTNTGNYQTPGTIGLYTASGASINPALSSGLPEPSRVAISGSDVFITNANGKIGKYTTSGATVTATLIAFGGYPVFPAVTGTDLFVTDMSVNRINKFTTSGATVNLSFIPFIPGLNGAGGLAVSDGKLYVASRIGTIGEYDAATGATINASLVTGLSYPVGLSLFDGHLFVVNFGSYSGGLFKGYVGEYDLDGTPVNPALITGLTNPIDIAVANIPDPSAGVLLVAGLASLIRRRRNVAASRASISG